MTGCTNCGKKIGRIERLQLRVVRRVFSRAEKRFDVNLNSKKYGGLCKICTLGQASTRLSTLTMELQVEADKAGMSVKEYGEKKVKELKEWIEKESGKEAKKLPKMRGGFRK